MEIHRRTKKWTILLRSVVDKLITESCGDLDRKDLVIQRS